MDAPFFGNRRRYQQPAPTRYPFSHSPSFGGVPIYEVDPTRETHRPAHPVQSQPEKKSAPKVVKIPVHFVGAEPVDRSASALKIQKVLRGFLVRKCMKKIKDVKVQVDEIGEKLLKSEVVELVRRDEKERLRMNESLMSQLFKLDSICGVDFGVRACRKAVIRRVIALQEKIDAIVAIDLDGNCENVECVDEEIETAETHRSNESGDPSKPEDDCSENCGNLDKNVVVDEGINDGEVDIIEVGVDGEVKANCVKNNDNKRNGELLERMMEDNEKMMNMMRQLFERNETQMRMLNALTNRVELLEKAFVCDKLRGRKKKKTKTKSEDL